MRILKIYDDLPNLHWVGLDSELQKQLGDEWQVEFFKIASWTRIEQVYPIEKETDGTDVNINEDEIFIFWNYHWGPHQEELQKQIEQKYLDLIKQGAKIKIQIYSSYGKYDEDERRLDYYTNLFGKEIVINNVEKPMHSEYMAKDFARRYAKRIKAYYK